MNVGEPPTSLAVPLDNITLTEDLKPSSVPSIQENFDDKFYLKGNGSMSSNETLLKGVIASNISSEVDDYSAEDSVAENEIITVDKFNQSTGGYATEEDMPHDLVLIHKQTNATVDSDSSSRKVNSPVPLENRDSSMNNSISPTSATLPSVLSVNMTSLTNVNNNTRSHLASTLLNTPPPRKELMPDVLKDQHSGRSGGDPSHSAERSTAGAAHRKEKPQTPAPSAITISEMNRLLDQSLSTYRSMVSVTSSFLVPLQNKSEI